MVVDIEVTQASVSFALLIGSLALSAASTLLRKPKSPIVADDKPEQLATRGSYVPLVIGRRRVGPAFVWITPDSPAVQLSHPGGLTVGKGPGTTSGVGPFEEAGLHVLCVGPGAHLHGILENGKDILRSFVGAPGSISPQSHPSGTLVDLGAAGAFKIFWGFPDDPVISELGAATNHGVATSYPYALKILWLPKKLGSVRQWPRLLYDVEVLPYGSSIQSEPAVLPGSATEDLPLTPEDYVTSGDKPFFHVLSSSSVPSAPYRQEIVLKIHGGSYRTVAGEVGSYAVNIDARIFFQAGSVAAVFGRGTSFGSVGTVIDIGSFGGSPASGSPVYYWVIGSSYSPGEQYDPDPLAGPGRPIYRGITTVRLRFLAGQKVSISTFSPGVGIGTPASELRVYPVHVDSAAGINLAHIVEQLLFAPAPHGGGRDRQYFDLDSLEELAKIVGISGTSAAGEALHGSLEVIDGETLQEALSRLMLEAGFMLPLCPRLGKFVFSAVRAETPIQIAEGHALPAPSSDITVRLRRLPASRATFTFLNQERNFRADPLTLSVDGRIVYGEAFKAKNVDISTTTHFDSAARIALRLEPTVFADGSTIAFSVLRDAAFRLRVGAVIDVPELELDASLRVVSIEPSQMSSAVRIEAVADHYSEAALGGELADDGSGSPLAARSDKLIANRAQGAPAQGRAVSIDPQIGIFELGPPLILPSPTLIVAGIRSSRAVQDLQVWVSSDGVGYVSAGSAGIPWAGGVLTSALPSNTRFFVEAPQAPIFLPFGPDLLQIAEDLSSNDADWRSGRQIVVFSDGTDSELCYFKSITLQSGLVRIDGLIRARLGTSRHEWPAGTRVFIQRSRNLSPIQNPALLLGRQMHVKVLAVGTGGSQSLMDVAAIQTPPIGKFLTPVPVGAIHTSNNLNGWLIGEDLSLHWPYSTHRPRAAAGMQGAGTAIGAVAPRGQFRVTLHQPGAPSIYLEKVVSQANVVFTNLEITSFFGDEPPELIATVTHLDGVGSSAPTSVNLLRSD